jgi:D-alanyl-D-alanine carboxypeptidase (penicillin-binding protein 5/6)
MRQLPWRAVRAALVVVLAGALIASAPARASDGPPPPLPALAHAWVLVDVDTGRVLEANNEHERRRPGSTIKLLTVLTARDLVPDWAIVPVSAHAASMPARSIGLRPGARWTVGEITDAVLLVSANDAAVALAERAANGDLDRFALAMQAKAHQIGLVDAPVLEDPTGLDHTYNHGDGDWISAWDLALVGRRAMDDPKIATTARLTHLDFVDAAGIPHHLLNRDQLIGSYPGATGLKTGFTHAAGNCLVATATRAGRTMLAVLMGSSDLYRDAGTLLDRGFATPVTAESGARLDGSVVPAAARVPTTRSTPRTTSTVLVTRPHTRRTTDTGAWWLPPLGTLALLLGLALLVRWVGRTTQTP